MAMKKERAWFTCPRWNEVASAATDEAVNAKTLTALKGGQPMARSTVRKALLAVRQASGTLFDIDEYIVDQRPAR